MSALGRSHNARDVVDKLHVLILAEVNDVVTDDEPDHRAIRLDGEWGVRPGRPLEVPSLVDYCDPHGKHNWRVGQNERHDFLAGVLVDVVEYLIALFWTSGCREVSNLVRGFDVIWELCDKAPLDEIASRARIEDRFFDRWDG